ncbi:MAG: hypothetical protein NTY22_00745 [Proteobacteria bacterium]|nr:hypothetical protein [Pseudomonadota bacterium]
MLLIVYTMIFAACFGSSSDKITKLTPERYEELKNDRAFLDILSQEIVREENKILKNKAVLKNTEDDLGVTVKHGLTEKELCIRQDVSVLRTVDYVYNMVLEQVKDVKYNEVKLNTIQILDRMRYLNKIFADKTLRIEECKFRISAKNKDFKNEMISNRIDTKIDVIKADIEIPEDYPAARAPFR